LRDENVVKVWRKVEMIEEKKIIGGSEIEAEGRTIERAL
jgi:hypothetical protein